MTAGRWKWKCPACDGISTKCYRCSECGHDFAGNQKTAGRQDTGGS